MSRARARRTAVIVALVATLAACTGSGDGPDGGAGSASGEERLARLPGMSAASIESASVDEDVEVTQVVVDADAGATAEQVGAVVDEVLGHEADYAIGDAPVTGVVYLGAGTTEWIDPDFPASDLAVPSGIWWGSDQGAPAEGDRPLEERAAWLVGAAALVPDATVVVDHDQDLKIRVPDFDTARVGEVAAAVQGTGELAGAPTVVSAGDWVREVDHDPVAVLAGNPLTPGLIDAWDAFASSAERAPGLDVRELSLGPLLTGELDQSLAADVVNGDTTIQLPGAVAPRTLTPEKYGGTLWPMLRAQLDVVGSFGAGSTLTAVNLVRSAEGGDVDDIDVFLSLTSGSPPARDDLGRGWNTEAAAYVAQR